MGMMQRLGQALGFNTGAKSPWSSSDVLGQITLKGLYGDVSSIPVRAASALRLPVLAKGRRQLVGMVGRSPLLALTSSNQPHKTQPQIIVQPDPAATRANTFAWIATELYLYPCAYTLITERNSYGFPHRLQPVPHSSAETNELGQLIAVDGKPVNPADTLRFDGLDGGILAEGADTIRRALVLNRVAALAEQNPVPTVELHNDGPDLNDEQIEKFIDSYRNARRKHGVAYTSKAVQLKVHGTQPENLLIDGRKRLDLALAQHANLPAWAADLPVEGSSLTYQNRQTKNQELIDQFVSSYTTVIEQRLSLDDVTPHGTTVKFQFDELTTPDMKTRFDTYALGKQHGFITNEQISEWEGWPTAAPETKENAQ